MYKGLELRNFMAVQGTERSLVTWRQDTNEVIQVSDDDDLNEVVVVEMESSRKAPDVIAI